MNTHHGLMALGMALAISGCAGLDPEKEPLRITPRSEVASSPVVREVLPPETVANAAPPSTAPAAPAAAAAAAQTPPTAQAPATATTPAPAQAARPPAASGQAGSGKAPVLAHVAPRPGAKPEAPPAAPPAAAPASLPPGTLYVCTATVNGQPQRTAIEYEPRVRQLCSKHPEMSVCQYERDACRASGGRVHTVNGVEITRQTEAEYDKKVLRVRFRAG